MRAAFAECELKGVDSVGWRAEVEKKGMTKGRKKERRVLVFGQWFKLDDPDMIRPINQEEEEEDDDDDDEGEEDEGDSEDRDNSEGEGCRRRPHHHPRPHPHAERLPYLAGDDREDD